MPKRYEMLGRPNVPFPEIQDHRVGDVFEADIDPDTEYLLLGAGALRVIEDVKPKTHHKPAAKSDAKKPDE
jgi:hypothetical protein